MTGRKKTTSSPRSARSPRRRVARAPHVRHFSTHILSGPPAPVVRKSADLLTAQEQGVFKNAVTRAIADGIYSRLVRIHADMTHDMHTMPGMGTTGTQRFLPWHRLYLIKFEQAMRAFEPTFCVPYWRWMDRSAIPAWLASFRPSGVTDTNGHPIPVTRAPGTDQTAPTLPTSAQIQASVMSRNDYRTFTLALEGAQPFGAHNLVHVWFNGTMSNVPTAPADPMFWMHHAELDRLWTVWAAAHTGQVPSLTGAKRILDPWPESAGDALDTHVGEYAYSYDRMTL
ncbi:MAG: tyrosinase family protein [Acidobacteria bacterium]|nr:tyrosinase family protein [Acidobacteriota bacterium]